MAQASCDQISIIYADRRLLATPTQQLDTSFLPYCFHTRFHLVLPASQSYYVVSDGNLFDLPCLLNCLALN